MPFTYTGRHVSLEQADQQHPSLIDIAVQTSRMPRFAGATRRWWSVLDHMLFGDYLLLQEKASRGLRISWLLHDAHEALTGDVPTPLKSAGLRITQAQLDQRIYGAFGYDAAQDLEAIKRLDRRVMLAEVYEIGPPVTSQELREAFPTVFSTENDREHFRNLDTATYGRPPNREGQEQHPAVIDYVRRMTSLL